MAFDGEIVSLENRLSFLVSEDLSFYRCRELMKKEEEEERKSGEGCECPLWTIPYGDA